MHPELEGTGSRREKYLLVLDVYVDQDQAEVDRNFEAFSIALEGLGNDGKNIFSLET